MDTTIKSVAYARVSTVLQGQDPEHQLVPIRDIAKSRGYTLVAEYVDRISGTTPTEKRKALDELVKQARQGKFKVVIIYALDRLGRDLRHLLNLLHELDALGITVVSIRESLDFGSPMGRACIALIGIMSQLEREWISQRIKTALAVKKLTAQQTGSGWRAGRPELDQSIVTEVIALRDSGLSYRAIRKHLNGRVSLAKISMILKSHRETSVQKT